jgi:ammonia channel protein AmtB
MLIAMGLLGGFFLAVFASVAADLWSGVILERWQVEADLGLPVLAQLPDRF